MLKTIKNVFYYGEFGYFNFMILGHLDEYFKNNNKKIIIRTYEDYYKILDLKFPNRFLKPTTSIDVPSREKRIYHRIQNEKFNNYLLQTGEIPLEKLLKCEIKNWHEGRKKIKLISSPILLNSQKKQNNKRYISILCRKRVIDEDRNLSIETWTNIINEVKKVFPNNQIVFHGLKEETVEIDNSLFCEDILESIKYLNESIVFISSMSGFAQFASNCNCSILQIGPAFQMIPYNPFDKINLQIERDQLNGLHNYLTKYSL